MVTMVMPGFWVGIIFLILFSVKPGLFPSSGYGDGLQTISGTCFCPR